jgi:drug/metabolite transporter (DMT)-like permease
VSAAFCALGLVLQQKGTLEAPEATSSGFIAAIFSKPVWLAGAASQVLGWVTQALALKQGTLFLVQPVISLQVVFALPLGIWITRQRVGRREWLGALAVVAGLAVYLGVSNPSQGRSTVPADVWASATVVVIVVVALLAAFGWRRAPTEKAACLGTAAGILYGYQAAAMKDFTQVAPDGFLAMVTSWSSYALLISALGGFYLVQASLQTGALAPSIATSNAANPLTSAALGRTMFLEIPQRTAGGKIASFGALVVLLIGLVWLARGKAAADEQRQEQPRPT